MRYNGKVAVVTGGARGIGGAVALALGKEGAVVNIVDVLAPEGNALAGAIRDAGGKAQAYEVDVANSGQVRKMVQDVVTQYGSIDVLVNAAGILLASRLIDCLEADWDRVININLKGTFLCSQAVGRHMIKQKAGSIVNLASVAGSNPQVGLAAYSPSKAGIILLTKLMACEWAEHNIRVNCVSPGPISTAIIDGVYNDPVKRAARALSVPQNRFGLPEEVAAAVLFLASDEASYVTGENLAVDGGSQASVYHQVEVIMKKVVGKD